MSSILLSPKIAPIPSAYPPISPINPGPWSARYNSKIIGGTITTAPIIDVESLNFSGQFLRTYFEDYYNRVWVLPNQSIDFGEVSAFTEVSRSLWNAFLTPTTLTSVSGGVEGVGYSEILPGQTLDPLEVRSVVFNADESGPNTISGTFTFNFSQGGGKVFTLSGKRSLIWPTEDFSVNWSVPYETEIEYRTDIFVSRNGKEQRRAQRRKPRKRITYQSIFQASSLRKFNAILANRQTRTFTIPEETKTVLLSADALSGSNTLSFANVPSWVQAGFSYMLLLDNKREVVRVETVSPTSVTLTANLQNDWYKDEYFVPLLTVRMATSIAAPLVTNGVATVTQAWEVEPTTEPFEEETITYPQYEGYYVFTDQHNWGESLSVQKNYEREEVDFGKGRARYFTPIDFPNQVRTLSVVTEDPAETSNIRQLFQKMRGRAGEFWLPTWERDLELISDVSAGSDRLLCEGTDLFNYYEGDKVFQNVMIMLVDGSKSYHRILSYQLLGNDTEVQLTEPLPLGLELSEVELICFLPRVRFGSDTLTTSWLTREVASVSIAFQTLEDL
jgi:hypothetical protein